MGARIPQGSPDDLQLFIDNDAFGLSRADIDTRSTNHVFPPVADAPRMSFLCSRDSKTASIRFFICASEKYLGSSMSDSTSRVGMPRSLVKYSLMSPCPAEKRRQLFTE